MIFLDANYFINLYAINNKDPNNENYNRAKEIYRLIRNREKIISNSVIMEVITVLNVRLKQDPYLVSKVHEELNKNYKIINDTEFHEKGFQILQNEFKKNKIRLPLFDSVYIAIMQDLGIKEIVSFDEHLCDSLGSPFSVIQ